jgi:hypothetical protein
VELLLVLGLVLLPLALGLVLLPLLHTCFVTGSQHLTVLDELAPGAGVVLGVWAGAIPMVAISIAAASRLTVIRMRIIPSRHVRLGEMLAVTYGNGTGERRFLLGGVTNGEPRPGERVVDLQP